MEANVLLCENAPPGMTSVEIRWRNGSYSKYWYDVSMDALIELVQI